MLTRVTEPLKILAIAGPTASGKTSHAIKEAKARDGEVISVDSRQVYRMLDIGTEKPSQDEREGIPHHLIDIRDPKEPYTAGDFVNDATRLISEIQERGKLPILAGGSLFYFDALLNGLPDTVPPNPELREELERCTNEKLFARVLARDPRRATELDPKNRRRLIRALEIIEANGSVSPRGLPTPPFGTRLNLVPNANTRSNLVTIQNRYNVEWIVLNPPAAELRTRIDARLESAFARGLIEEVRRVREYVGDERLTELGLEYRIVGEYLRSERTVETLLPTLSSKLHQYAGHQRAWLRKLSENKTIS